MSATRVATGGKLDIGRLCEIIHRGITDLAWHYLPIVHHRKCERQTLVVVAQDFARVSGI